MILPILEYVSTDYDSGTISAKFYLSSSKQKLLFEVSILILCFNIKLTFIEELKY